MPISSIDGVAAEIAKREYHGAEVAMLIVGSHAHELATDRSDLDLIAVLPEGHDDLAKPTRYYGGVQNDICFEIGRISQAQAEQCVSWCRLPDYRVISRRDRGLLEKLVSGRPVSGHAYHSDLLARIDWDQHSAKMRRYYRTHSGKIADDVCGALRSGRLEMACNSMRDLILTECEAFLCGLGDTYGKPKWIFERFSRIPDLPLEISTGLSDILFFRSKGSSLTLHQWLKDASQFHWRLQCEMFAPSVPPIRTSQRCGPGIAWTPTETLRFLRHIDGAWILTTPERQVVLDDLAARILLLVDRPHTTCTLAMHLDADEHAVTRTAQALCNAAFLDGAVQ